MARFILSAFADEADALIENQIKALKENSVTHIELRGVDSVNISEITPERAKRLAEQLKSGGISVSAIGSPIGKIGVTEPFDEHFEKFKYCVENALLLGSENIRLFSFYIPSGEKPEKYSGEVIDRLARLCEYADSYGVCCCHENEKGIYGDNPERCLELLEALNGSLRAVFDPANFVQCAVKPLEAYKMLEKHIKYMHIKDAVFGDGSVVPAGMGDGQIKDILRLLSGRDGDIILTLEPHLAVFDGLSELEQKGGTADKLKNKTVFESNSQAFAFAAKALRDILAEL